VLVMVGGQCLQKSVPVALTDRVKVMGRQVSYGWCLDVVVEGDPDMQEVEGRWHGSLCVCDHTTDGWTLSFTSHDQITSLN